MRTLVPLILEGFHGPAELCVARLCGEGESARSATCSWRRWPRCVPWGMLEALIEHALSEDGAAGRSAAFPAPRHAAHLCLQQWYTLCSICGRGGSALRHPVACARSAASSSAVTPFPTSTTILNFRHLLERHELTKAISRCRFGTSRAPRRTAARRHHRGRDADRARRPPRSNKERRRDARDCRSRRRESQAGIFGMKAHVGAACRERAGAHGGRDDGQGARRRR